MNIGEFGDLERNYCKSVDIHQVCLMCQFICKRDYTLWHGMVPPQEYCDAYEPHEYWIAIMRLADTLEGN